MQRNTKDWIHYSSAGIVLLAGIVLVYISFFCPTTLHQTSCGTLGRVWFTWQPSLVSH